MPAPVVGLTTYREHASWGVWDQRADLLHVEYADAVVAVGGLPVLLPPMAVPGAADEVVTRLDALVISGGADVDPALYGAEAHARTAGTRPDRDAWELALLDAAGVLSLPVLGVCRGMQVMAVHAGGRLEQHLPDRLGTEAHSPGGAEYGPVQVTTTPGSRVAGLLGAATAVRCHHHQGVVAHPGLDAVAHAADGTIEAVERPGRRFEVAVQWHPETAADVGLLAGLVRAAAEHAVARLGGSGA